MTKAEVLELQRSLNQSGVARQALGEPLVEDGIYGPQTAAAYRARLAQEPPQALVILPPVSKPWWTSRAVLGLLASLLAMLAGRFGWSIDDDQITAVLLQLVEAGGLIFAAWGTLRRQAPIDPGLVARVGARDVRLPVRADGQAGAGSTRQPAGDDPRGVFRDY